MSALYIFPSENHPSAPLQKKQRGGGETEGWMDGKEGRKDRGRSGCSGVVGFMDEGMVGGREGG